MPKIEYRVVYEASGDRPLSQDKIVVQFDDFENGEITDSAEFSVAGLKKRIEQLESDGKDTDIYRNALNEAQE